MTVAFPVQRSLGRTIRQPCDPLIHARGSTVGFEMLFFLGPLCFPTSTTFDAPGHDEQHLLHVVYTSSYVHTSPLALGTRIYIASSGPLGIVHET